MDKKKDFDEYSNYDDRQLHNNKAEQKIGRTKEEFGAEQNIQAQKQSSKKRNS